MCCHLKNKTRWWCECIQWLKHDAMCLQENNNPHKAQSCKPEVTYTEEFSYEWEERNSTLRPVISRSIGGKHWVSTMSTAILMAGWEGKANFLLPQWGKRCCGLSAGTLSCSHAVHVCCLIGVQGACSATRHLFALCRPCMHCCSWPVSCSFWKIWSAHGTPLLLTSVHERARGISPEHLLSLVP